MAEELTRNHPYIQILKSECENSPAVINLTNRTETLDDYMFRNIDENVVYVAFTFSETPYQTIFEKVENSSLTDEDFENFEKMVKKIFRDLFGVERYDLVKMLYTDIHNYTVSYSHEEYIFEYFKENKEVFRHFTDFLQDFLYSTLESGNCEIVDIILEHEDLNLSLPIHNIEDKRGPYIKSIDVVRKILTKFPQFFDQFRDFSISFYQADVGNLFKIENLSRKLFIPNSIDDFSGFEGFIETYPAENFLSRNNWRAFYFNRVCNKLLEFHPEIVVDGERIKRVIRDTLPERFIASTTGIDPLFFERILNRKFRLVSETEEIEALYRAKIEQL